MISVYTDMALYLMTGILTAMMMIDTISRSVKLRKVNPSLTLVVLIVSKRRERSSHWSYNALWEIKRTFSNFDIMMHGAVSL